MIRNLISHLLVHDVYAVIFERHILEQTLSSYTTEGEVKKEQLKLGAEQFLVHVTERTCEERERAEAICRGVGETVKEIVQACRRGLLETRLDWLARGGAWIFIVPSSISDVRGSFWPAYERTGYGPTPCDLYRVRSTR